MKNRLVSPTFPVLNLTTEDVFTGKI